MRVRRGMGLVALALFSTMLVSPPADAAVGNCTPILHRGLYQGTENQPRGITYAAKWGGLAEIDANVTYDGYVMAVHDFNLKRVTDGTSSYNINQVTREELLSYRQPYGPFQETTTLIETAAALDRPIMVTINKWGQIFRSVHREEVLDTLYEAAQAHPHPNRVYFGGADGPMHRAHPDAATFKRYTRNVPIAEIVAEVTEQDIDLVGLSENRFTRRTVNRVRAAGARVATRQLSTRAKVRKAQQAGITWIQGSHAKEIATKWCR